MQGLKLQYFKIRIMKEFPNKLQEQIKMFTQTKYHLPLKNLI